MSRSSKQARPPYVPGPWFGGSGAIATLEQEVLDHGGWKAASNPRVREYLAREVLDGKMPITYVARNHGLPLSRVRRWVAVYRSEGRKGLEALTDKTT